MAHLTEVASSPKCKKLWNYVLELPFKELKRMVSSETLFNYTYWTINFTVHTYASDKQLGAVNIHNNKPVAFLSGI